MSAARWTRKGQGQLLRGRLSRSSDASPLDSLPLSVSGRFQSIRPHAASRQVCMRAHRLVWYSFAKHVSWGVGRVKDWKMPGTAARKQSV